MKKIIFKSQKHLRSKNPIHRSPTLPKKLLNLSAGQSSKRTYLPHSKSSKIVIIQNLKGDKRLSKQSTANTNSGSSPSRSRNIKINKIFESVDLERLSNKHGAKKFSELQNRNFRKNKLKINTSSKLNKSGISKKNHVVDFQISQVEDALKQLELQHLHFQKKVNSKVLQNNA